MSHAFIIAGGKGERLKPHTENKPKCMVPVMGQPLLAHSIRWLVSYGFSDVTICCGYLHKIILDYFDDGSKFGANITYVKEESPLGRGGAFKEAFKQWSGQLDQPVLGINGDIITNLNLQELLKFHTVSAGLATIVATPLTSPYGIIDINQEGIVHGFREKPRLPFWINAGIYVFEPAIAELLPDHGDHETLTFPYLAEKGHLKAFKADNAFWRSVDTVKDLNELRDECEQIFYGSFLGKAFTHAMTRV